jgi:hypothetical protein
MTIRIVRKTAAGAKASGRPAPPPAPPKKPSDYARRPAGADGRGAGGAAVKWTIIGIVALAALILAVAKLSEEPATIRPDVSRLAVPAAGGERGSHSLDGVDLKQWCREHEKENEALQARKARRRGYSGR